MLSKRYIQTLYGLLFVFSIYLICQEPNRSQVYYLIGLFSIAFISYLGILRYVKMIPFKYLIVLAVAVYAIAAFFPPGLSEDYYRFLWDGELTARGLNPFNFTPDQLFAKGYTAGNTYLQELYDGITTLSKRHYTCYPPFNQLYFVAAASISESIYLNMMILKLLIIGSMIVGAIYLMRTLKLLGIDQNRVWVLYLNPLWVIEAVANMHFEGVMISFLFIAIYFLLQLKEKAGSVFFALSVQLKLIPLILLPFFYRFLGIKRSAIFYILTIGTVILLGMTQLNSGNIDHFVQSIRLYFHVFEFNSFVLHYYLQYGWAEWGWNLIYAYVPRLARLTIIAVAFLSLYGQIDNWKKLFNRMTIAFFIYLLLSATIHPWYILPLLALSIFTNYTFAIAWSYTVFFSYIIYAYFDSQGNIRWIIDAEYAIVMIWSIYELILKKSPFTFLRRDAYDVSEQDHIRSLPTDGRN